MKEKIIDRIRKMMKLRDDAAATQGEIENASALIQKLLFEHNLTIDEIGEVQAERYELFTENPDQRKRESDWVPRLYYVIAKWNFCSVVVTSKRDNPNDRAHKSFFVRIVGKPSDVEVVKYLCSWLIPKIRGMANEAYRNYNGIEKSGKFMRGYYAGCVQGLDFKLKNEHERLKQETPQANALVLRRDTELANAVSQFFPRLGRHRRSTGLSGRDGYSQGHEAGRNLNLTRGITETRKSRLLG